MKFVFISLFVICPFFLTAQKGKPAPKDSIEFFRKIQNELWRNAIDSVRNSEKYKELGATIARLRGISADYGGVVLFGDLIHSDYTKFNQSITASGFTAMKTNLVRMGFGFSSKSGNSINDFYFAVAGFNNGSKKDMEKIKTSLSSVMQYEYGYDLTRSTMVDIYPFLGLSLRFSNLTYIKPAETNTNYTNISDILINNQSTISSSFRLGYQAGLGLDFHLSAANSKKPFTIFFTKFGVNRPFSIDKYKIEGVNYKPEIRQGIWVLAVGFKFVSPQ